MKLNCNYVLFCILFSIFITTIGAEVLDESISLVINIQGVTEQNKNAICSSIGNAIGGTVIHCSLSGPSGRRRLESESVPLYVDIAVASAEEAENTIISSTFISTLEDLPSEVTVDGISLYEIETVNTKLAENAVVPDVLSELTTDVGVATISYEDANVVTMDNVVLTPTVTVSQPTMTWDAEDGVYYTAMMTDPDAISRDNPIYREYGHMVVVNVMGGELAPGAGDEVISYTPPGPPYNSGLHRYVFLVYAQSGELAASEVAATSFPNGATGGYKFADIASSYGLELIAANLFEAEWDEMVDTLHESWGWLPPEGYRSPYQLSQLAVFGLETSCATSSFTSDRILQLREAFVDASGAELDDVSVHFDETSSPTRVGWIYTGENSVVVQTASLLSFENELKAELLPDEFLRDCFGLSDCEDDVEDLDQLVGEIVIANNGSCAVYGSIYFVIHGTDACNNLIFLEKCPVTCGTCACAAKDCNNQGTTDDLNYADGCECTCNPGFMGENCEGTFTNPPSTMPSNTPTIAFPSRSPSLAPSCYEYLPDTLGNTDLHISAADSGFDGTNFKIAMYVPNIYEILSLSFVGSDLVKYQGRANPGVWIETPIPCLRVWSAVMDYETFLGLTTFENNQFCSAIDVDIYENHQASRSIKYNMPWCVNVATEMRVAASIDVNIDEPGFLYVSRTQATMHPDHYRNEALLVLEFSTQVVFPWVLETSFTMGQTTNIVSRSTTLATNIVPGSTTLVETDKQCNSRDYCWQDWRLEFRVDSVCLRIFNLDLRMTAVYENERKEAAVTSEILPEASCGAVIDDVNTPLSGAILLSPDASDFSQETQLYRYHIEETVYAQITISDNLAPITNVAVAEYTLTQNGNTFDQPFTNIANNGNQAVVSFDLNEPVAGTIPGIVTTLTVKVDITYGDGTVRRRQLRSEYERNDLPDEYSVSSTFIVQMPGCLAPEGNAGEVLRSKCRAGDSAEIRLCERGLWRLLGESCPESPLILESKDADDVQTASSKQYTWEILFFAVSFLAILVLGYVSYKCCYAKPQEATKTLQTIVVA